MLVEHPYRLAARSAPDVALERARDRTAALEGPPRGEASPQSLGIAREREHAPRDGLVVRESAIRAANDGGRRGPLRRGERRRRVVVEHRLERLVERPECREGRERGAMVGEVVADAVDVVRDRRDRADRAVIAQAQAFDPLARSAERAREFGDVLESDA